MCRTFVLFLALLASCTGDPASGSSVAALGSSALPAAGFGDPGVTSSPPPAGWPAGSVSFCCTTWWTPIATNVGDVIGGVTLQVKDNGGAQANNLIVSLVAQPTGSSSWTTLGFTTSPGTGTAVAMAITLTTPYVVPAGITVLVRVAALAGGALPGPATLPSTIGPVAVVPGSTPAPRQIVVPTPMPGSSSPIFVPSNNPLGVGYPPVMRSAMTGVGAEYFIVPFTSGKTVTGFSIDMYGQGTGDVEIDFAYGTISSPPRPIGDTISISNVASTWHRYTMTGISPTLLQDDGQLLVIVDPDQTIYFSDVVVTLSP